MDSMTNFEIARGFANLSSIELANLLGVTPQQVSNWAKGLRTPTRANAEAIAEALGVDPAWLLGVAQTLPVLDPIHGDVYAAPIMRSETIPAYGVLYHVWVEEIDNLLPVIVAGGVQFTLTDWDASDIPRTAADIHAYRWIGPAGQDAVMLDGLPRVIA